MRRRREGARGRRLADRRGEPRLLRHVRRDLRLPGAGDLGRARLLPRRRDRHRGLVGFRDRVRGRDVRPARDRPRRDGRGDPRDADVRHAGGAAHAAHGRADRRAGGVPARRPAARGAARGAARRRARARAEDRREEPEGGARGEGVAERDRADRPAQELSLRAGLHARALHRAPTLRSRATRSSRSATRSFDRARNSSTNGSHLHPRSRTPSAPKCARGCAPTCRPSRCPPSTRATASRRTAAGSTSSTRAATRWCRGRSSTAGAAPTCSSG